eukprot:9487577-Pyramimonas_sp.AAC.1
MPDLWGRPVWLARSGITSDGASMPRARDMRGPRPARPVSHTPRPQGSAKLLSSTYHWHPERRGSS